jgi:hypothetical protein
MTDQLIANPAPAAHSGTAPALAHDADAAVHELALAILRERAAEMQLGTERPNQAAYDSAVAEARRRLREPQLIPDGVDDWTHIAAMARLETLRATVSEASYAAACAGAQREGEPDLGPTEPDALTRRAEALELLNRVIDGDEIRDPEEYVRAFREAERSLGLNFYDGHKEA